MIKAITRGKITVEPDDSVIRRIRSQYIKGRSPRLDIGWLQAPKLRIHSSVEGGQPKPLLAVRSEAKIASDRQVGNWVCNRHILLWYAGGTGKGTPKVQKPGWGYRQLQKLVDWGSESKSRALETPQLSDYKDDKEAMRSTYNNYSSVGINRQIYKARLFMKT